MPWQPLSRIAFAVCTYPFQPSSAADLPLEIGDELYIIEQGGADGAWYRGYLVAPPSLLAGLTSVKGQTLEARVFSGIFPRVCVEVREVLGEERGPGKGADRENHVAGTDGKVHSHMTNGTPSQDAQANPLPDRGSDAQSSRASRPSTAAAPDSSSISRTTKEKTHKLDGKSSKARPSVRKSALGDLPRLPLALTPASTLQRDPDAPRPPAPVPMLKIGDETPTSLSEPLVDEIASCLREWHSTNLHELLLAGRYSTLDKMSRLVRRLDMSRKQLLYKVLTDKELGVLRESLVWDLAAGNKMLSGDIVVRSATEKGRILTAEDSAIEMTRLQSMMSLLDERPTQHIDTNTLHHLLVDIKGVAGEFTQPITILMCLYTKNAGDASRPVSEVFAVDLTDSSAMITDGKTKTLFVDLSVSDIGEGSSSASALYLMLRIVTNEPLQNAPAPLSPRGSTSSQSGPPVNSATVTSAKSGRRSLMWGSPRNRKESTVSIKTINEQQSVNNDAATAKHSQGRPSSSSQNMNSTKDQRTAKRTVGLGVLRVDGLVRNKEESDQGVDVWRPSTVDKTAEEDKSWDSFIEEILPSASKSYSKSTLLRRIDVQLKSFIDPDAEALIKRTPTLLHNVSQTRKIGFSGAPTKPRSDIYLTLTELFLPPNALLSHPKSGTVPLGAQTSMSNLQLTLEVRKSTGERMENCIFPAGNSAGHTAWRTTAVERGEAWNTTIRLAISPEDVPGSHIIMSVADAPGFPFALCWMPLWNQDAFVRDGDHSLAFYKYDEYTSSMISGRGAYLALPWNSKRKDETVTGPIAALRLRTYLCSTKYSQDPNLLGLLKWREQNPSELLNLLRRFTFVPELEIVKLLNQVFDALFEILVEFAGSDEHEDLVFNALVTVLGIVHDRRFNLGPLVDRYAEERFNYPFATACLLRSYHRLLSIPTDPEAARKLRATFKVGGHVLKFIINARQQQNEKEAGIGITGRQPTFKRDLQNIFKFVQEMMQNPAPILIGTKTLVVQNFHSWLPALSALMTSEEILQLAISFIDSCAGAQGKLILFKLVLIINFAQLEVFKIPEIRRSLFMKTSNWLAPYWGKTETVTPQWKDQVRLCCSVVASQIDELGAEACDYIPKLVGSYRAIQSTERTTKDSLSLLFPTSYPFASRPASTSACFDEALIELSAVLAATSNLPAMIHLDIPEDEIAEFLFDALKVNMSILNCEAFPESWLSVNIYHHRSTMRSLEKISNVMTDSFLPHFDEADEFNTELWRAFFDTLLKLVGSDALALETFPEQKRRAVWKIAGDVREHAAELLRRSWEAIGWETGPEDRKRYGIEKMGGFQVQYVPGLVSPIVELCLSVHEGVRSVAIGVLQTMIVSEWSLNQDLAIIQAEMIDCLDKLFKAKHPKTESILQKLFIGELMTLFEPLSQVPDDSLYVAVKSLINTIDELLDLLVAVHCAETTGEAFHIMDTLHLMEFLRDVQKEDIYIRYVHQLARVQAEAGNYTEAGLALRLHAELYDWDPIKTLDALEDPALPSQTAFERKEQVYFQMIKHYEENLSWDNALGTYMELAEQYEHNIFDFLKLARTQRAMATIYESISKGETRTPRFFRVAYKGLGFPVALRDKQFIFEGSPSDRLATFTDRLLQQHPAARILTEDGEDELEGQYLEISHVSPQKNLLHPVYQRHKVAQPIRDYYLLSRPTRFSTATRRLANDGDGKERQAVKTVCTTAESFPTILRRSEIVASETVVLTPLQAAIERTTRKTSELLGLEKRAQSRDDAAFSALTEALTASVDTTSEASLFMYRKLLPEDDEAEMDGEDEEDTPLEPLANALKIALADHAWAIKRCLALYTRPAQQATRAELTQRK